MVLRRFVTCLGLSCLTAASARAGDEVAGARFQGVFFPYVYEASALHPLAIAVATQPVTETKRCRRIGAVAGGVGGFLAFAPVAISDSRIGVSDSERLLEWSAVTAGSALLGYFIGRKLDRRANDAP